MALDGAGIATSKRSGITAVARSAGPDRSRKTARWTPQAIGTVAHLRRYDGGWRLMKADRVTRSEEHTSELQSLMRISYAVFCLTKKKIKRTRSNDKVTK